jgi:ribonuclease VapC
MLLDASAIVAILNREPGWQRLAEKISTPVYMSPVARFEATVSLARIKAQPTDKRPTADTIAMARDIVDDFASDISALGADITDEVGSLAIDASMQYGKVVGHPAALNFGDCFAYACAKALNVPLLYKGNDFAQTDLA